jgi:hypothetical protein
MKAAMILSGGLMLGAMSLGCGDSDPTPAGDATADASNEVAADVNDTGSDAPTAGVPCDPPTDGTGAAVACVTGRLVDEAGAPVPNLPIGACTLDVCIRSNTNADGRYVIGRLTVNAQKMLVFGVAKGFAQMIYYQDVTPGVLTSAPHDVVLHKLAAPDSDWPVATGGTVLLASGQLELSAAADTLIYPIGAGEKVSALEIDVADLPPFDISPWTGHEEQTRAFIVNPYPMHASTGVVARVLGATGVAAGAQYRVYAAHSVHGTLEDAGLATADGNGAIVLAEGSLTDLTTLVFVPAN